MRIAFIGLGNMGGPMALNLIKAGHTLIVYDVRKETGAPHLAQAPAGAPTCAMPRARASSS
jgi:3-hydroxyisobutyrate dehydrogenase